MPARIKKWLNVWSGVFDLGFARDMIYPTPRDVGLKVPSDIREPRFNAGFEHALKGGQLSEVECFRRSFRLGFRVAKLYLREVRRRRGILDFPLRARIRQRAIWLGAEARAVSGPRRARRRRDCGNPGVIRL